MNRQDTSMAPRQTLVYVALPVHNRREITLAFVECLLGQNYGTFRLMLIDDGSTDGTADAVLSLIPDTIVIRGKGTWWWGGSLQQVHHWFKRNQTAGDDVILIMNDDTRFDADFIANGLRLLGEHKCTLLTATGYNLKNGAAQDSGGYIMDWSNMGFSETYDNTQMNCTSTRGLMVRVADFLDVGGFHPLLIPHYLSDLEFTMRARERGKTLMIHPDFRIGIDFETTGIREVNQDGLRLYLKKTFSTRSAMNPVYWSNFIMLRSPWRFKLSNLLMIWGAVYKQVVFERLIPRLLRMIGC
jgi:glycosyltransferase involved in cell wall biosynthesis